ncbi:IclR family transcriptional regulator [Microbacterium lacticum]|uniref:IclR family transcriptional regulator n=1 Tax=Microbacterium lacticum TaxID=33885 RepID=UPI003A85210E
MSLATDRKGGYRDGNSTADRALTILLMFSDQRSQISANDVADHLGVSRSTAYRYAQTLVNLEFLVEDPGNGFRLGSKVMELARIARRSYGLSDMALPIMRELSAEFRETVLLTRRVGPAILCVEREEWPGQYIRLSYERGSRLSLNAGASAYILLAWLPESLVRNLLGAEELRSYTSKSLTEPDAILERLRQIRSDGYCVAQGEVDPDAIGIAAPVFDGAGDVCAGLSMVTLRSRLPDAALTSATARLVAGAQQLTELVSSFSH